MTRLSAVTLAGALCVLGAAPPAGAQPAPPELTVEAPDVLAAVGQRVAGLDTGRLAAVMRLTGLDDAGRPIRVVLVPETSRVARDTAPWVAAFADPPRSLIVLFPDRIGAYPYDSLEVVLHHEVAHVLAARAAGGGRLPRWFSEGVASVAERSWGLGSRTRFLWENLGAGEPTIAEVEGLFASGRRETARAYILAHAMVRALLQRYGPEVVPRILDGVAAGATFDQAFVNATGTTVGRATRLFWLSAGGWEEWITFLASPYTLWTLITTLSLLAIWRHRRRRALRRRLWDLEEQLEAEPWGGRASSSEPRGPR